MKRSFIREILEHTTDKTISFAGGLPDESLFPLEELQASANRVLSRAESLQYTTSQGYEPLREKIASLYTKQGFKTSSSEILITSGAQQALDIISRFYKGQSITIEAPSYLGAMNLFHLNNMKLSDVHLENDGIDITAFEKSFTKSRLAYLIPDFQNPTGIVYSMEKRKEIAAIIERYDGIVIEDAPYSELFFEERYPSISSMIPQHSFHIGSFSKMLAPAFRIGWIRADRKLLSPLIAYKEAMDLHTNSVGQRIINDYLEDGENFSNHLNQVRSHYKYKMEFFMKYLDEALPMFRYQKPKGGLFIYGSLKGVDTTKLLQASLKKEVVFVPGREFYTQQPKKNEIRFNFSRCSQEDIKKGIEIIRYILDEAHRKLK